MKNSRCHIQDGTNYFVFSCKGNTVFLVNQEDDKRGYFSKDCLPGILLVLNQNSTFYITDQQSVTVTHIGGWIDLYCERPPIDNQIRKKVRFRFSDEISADLIRIFTQFLLT